MWWWCSWLPSLRHVLRLRGVIYQRVSGATVPVKEPLVLLNLMQRGERSLEAARAAAERFTEFSSNTILEAGQWVFVSMAATSGVDMDSLFRPELTDRIREVIKTQLRPDYRGDRGVITPRVEWQQNEITASMGAGYGWEVVVHRLGVRVRCHLSAEQLGFEIFEEEILFPSLSVCESLCGELGVSGSAELRIRLVLNNFALYDSLDRGYQLPGRLHIERSLTQPAIGRDVEQSLGHELRRSGGVDPAHFPRL